MNSESSTNVLTQQWRIVTGSKPVKPRNRMPETGASGSVGAPLEESGALPGNSNPYRPPNTGAYADVVFGLFWLLGYRFSPRIADMGNSRLWRIDPKADYSPLNGVSRHRINADLILQHWDDLLRLAGSLKQGLVQATSIMRTLQVGDRPTKLAQAVAEVGRIDK